MTAAEVEQELAVTLEALAVVDAAFADLDRRVDELTADEYRTRRYQLDQERVGLVADSRRLRLLLDRLEARREAARLDELRARAVVAEDQAKVARADDRACAVEFATAATIADNRAAKLVAARERRAVAEQQAAHAAREAGADEPPLSAEHDEAEWAEFPTLAAVVEAGPHRPFAMSEQRRSMQAAESARQERELLDWVARHATRREAVEAMPATAEVRARALALFDRLAAADAERREQLRMRHAELTGPNPGDVPVERHEPLPPIL
jgi:hypothetical protein